MNIYNLNVQINVEKHFISACGLGALLLQQVAMQLKGSFASYVGDGFVINVGDDDIDKVVKLLEFTPEMLGKFYK